MVHSSPYRVYTEHGNEKITMDYGIEKMMLATRGVSLKTIITCAARAMDTKFVGFLPVKKKSPLLQYVFSDDELRVMRQVNEEVYNMPGLRAYFETKAHGPIQS